MPILRKPRSDSKLLNLPGNDQAAITQWLLDGLPYATVQKRIFEPFNIECSTKVISRFWRQIVSPILADQRAHLNDRARSLAQDRKNNPHAAEILMAYQLEKRLFELADAGKLPDDPVVILNLLDRLRRRQLQEEKFHHQLQREALEQADKTTASANVDYTRPLTDEERQAVLAKMKDLLGLTPDLPPPVPEPGFAPACGSECEIGCGPAETSAGEPVHAVMYDQQEIPAIPEADFVLPEFAPAAITEGASVPPVLGDACGRISPRPDAPGTFLASTELKNNESFHVIHLRNPVP